LAAPRPDDGAHEQAALFFPTDVPRLEADVDDTLDRVNF